MKISKLMSKIKSNSDRIGAINIRSYKLVKLKERLDNKIRESEIKLLKVTDNQAYLETELLRIVKDGKHE